MKTTSWGDYLCCALTVEYTQMSSNYQHRGTARCTGSQVDMKLCNQRPSPGIRVEMLKTTATVKM